MQGVLGLALIVIAFILLYDVVSGKSSTLLGLISGQTDTVSNWHGATGASTSISGNVTVPTGLIGDTTGGTSSSSSSNNGSIALNPPKNNTPGGIISV